MVPLHVKQKIYWWNLLGQFSIHEFDHFYEIYNSRTNKIGWVLTRLIQYSSWSVCWGLTVQSTTAAAQIGYFDPLIRVNTLFYNLTFIEKKRNTWWYMFYLFISTFNRVYYFYYNKVYMFNALVRSITQHSFKMTSCSNGYLTFSFLFFFFFC